MCIPGLGITLDPRLRWHVSRGGVAAGEARPDGFTDCPLSPGHGNRSGVLTKYFFRGRGVTRTKMAKLESALASVRRNVEQSALDCGATTHGGAPYPLSTPRWLRLATEAADDAMRASSADEWEGEVAAFTPRSGAAARQSAGSMSDVDPWEALQPADVRASRPVGAGWGIAPARR